MKLQAYQHGLSIETTQDQTIIKGEHSFGGVLVQESYIDHGSKGAAISFHIEAMQRLLNVDEPISSTKPMEQLPQPPKEIHILPFGVDTSHLTLEESLDKIRANREELALRARRERLLERIEELQDWQDRHLTDPTAGWAIDEIRDELAAVESALGYPEPKEPAEATQTWCPSCLCLYQHEDPAQSCQCPKEELCDICDSQYHKTHRCPVGGHMD